MGDSGFGGVGFSRTEGLDTAVGEGEAAVDKVELAGGAGIFFFQKKNFFAGFFFKVRRGFG